jgi:hypothetical protein
VEKHELSQMAFDNRKWPHYIRAPRRRRVLVTRQPAALFRLDLSGSPSSVHWRCDLTIDYTGKGNEGGVEVLVVRL